MINKAKILPLSIGVIVSLKLKSMINCITCTNYNFIKTNFMDQARSSFYLTVHHQKYLDIEAYCIWSETEVWMCHTQQKCDVDASIVGIWCSISPLNNIGYRFICYYYIMVVLLYCTTEKTVSSHCSSMINFSRTRTMNSYYTMIMNVLDQDIKTFHN